MLVLPVVFLITSSVRVCIPVTKKQKTKVHVYLQNNQYKICAL